MLSCVRNKRRKVLWTLGKANSHNYWGNYKLCYNGSYTRVCTHTHGVVTCTLASALAAGLASWNKNFCGFPIVPCIRQSTRHSRSYCRYAPVPKEAVGLVGITNKLAIRTSTESPPQRGQASKRDPQRNSIPSFHKHSVELARCSFVILTCRLIHHGLYFCRDLKAPLRSRQSGEASLFLVLPDELCYPNLTGFHLLRAEDSGYSAPYKVVM